jgi:hypothetical protein
MSGNPDRTLPLMKNFNRPARHSTDHEVDPSVSNLDSITLPIPPPRYKSSPEAFQSCSRFDLQWKDE